VNILIGAVYNRCQWDGSDRKRMSKVQTGQKKNRKNRKKPGFNIFCMFFHKEWLFLVGLLSVNSPKLKTCWVSFSPLPLI
jgi:hypothetical protein